MHGCGAKHPVWCLSTHSFAGGAYAILVRRQLAAGASQAESLASLDNQDGNNQQTPSMEAARPSSPCSDACHGDTWQPKGRSGSPDPRGHPHSPRKGGGRPPSPRRGAVKPRRSTSMTRQDTGAIVDAVMADVVGGDFGSHPDGSPQSAKQSPDSPS